MPGRGQQLGPVALVVDSPTFGGAEVYVDLLLRHLPSDIPRVLVVRTPGPNQLVTTAEELGLDIVSWSPDSHGLTRLERVARTAGIVHLNMTWPGANRQATALIAARRRPAVATVHLYIPPATELRRRVLRFAYRRFSRVIAVSRDIHRAVGEDLGVDPRVVRLVPNGVHRRTPRPPMPDPRPAVRIGAVGRLTRQKGFDLLVTAARGLLAGGHRVEVCIAGDGPERASLEEAGAGLPLHLVGPVRDIQGFLAALDVFCLPSRWEGLPFALLEAMMAGRPCVAADVGDVAEALGPAGLVVAPDDPQALATALGGLVASPEQRRLLGLAAHQRAIAHYSLDRMIERTVGVYQEVRTSH